MFVPRPKVLSVRRDNPCGCPRTRKFYTKPIPALKRKDSNTLPARFTARWHAPGNPRRGFPTAKQSAGLFCLPSCAFGRDRDFALCAGRPKVSPLDSTAFKKAGEILFSGRQFAIVFSFSPDRKFFRSLNRAKTLPGRESLIKSNYLREFAARQPAPTRFRCGRHRRHRHRAF